MQIIMLKRNISYPLTRFFACLVLTAITFFFMSFSEKERVTQLASGEIITDTIIVQYGINKVDSTTLKKTGMIRDEDSRPLTIVDGEEVTDIGYLKPEDIQSISVLKGETASGIYASKGKNGVILITTKKGAPIIKEPSITNTPFSLDDEKQKTFLQHYRLNSLSTNKPLYLIDGIEIPSIDDIDPNEIESISILKNEQSSKLYGDKAKNGVVIITTKAKAQENSN